MKLMEAETIIDADIDNLWEILIDFPNYGKWNSFCPGAESTGKVGDPIHMTVNLSPGKKPQLQTETITENHPYELGWSLNWGPFLKSHRLQTLEKLPNGSVRFYTYDKLWGLLTPLVMALYGKKIQAGMEQVVEDLKAFVD